MLLGSAITAPTAPGEPGVPNVAQMLDMIRAEFDQPEQIRQLNEQIDSAENPYQTAFSFLIGRRGQQAANEIIKQAVWRARKQIRTTDERAPYLPSATTSDDACKALELDLDGCLHMMGQIEPALVCYKKSAILLEMSGFHQHASNQAYIRQWIGELLIAREDYCPALYFYQASLQRWESVAPPRAERLRDRLETLSSLHPSCKPLSSEDAERFCIAWIYERETEFIN